MGPIYIHVVLDRPEPQVLRMLDDFSSRYKLTISFLKDRNLSSAMNLGIEKGSAEFIAVLDGDDEMAENRLSVQTNYLIENPDVAGVGSDFWQIDEIGNKMKYISMSNEKCKSQDFVSSPIAHSTAMLRRSKLLQSGGYRSFYQYAEDFDLWLRLKESYNLANINLPLASYRIHASQTTSHSYNRLAWVQVAARISRLERISGKIEIDAKYATFNEWKVANKFNIRVNYLVIFELLLHNLNEAINNGERSKKNLIRLTIYLLYPRQLARKLRSNN